MAHTYLKDVDFSHKPTDESCGAHIAYTFDFQGGAASGYNTPLLFKSEDGNQVSFEKLKALQAMGEDVTEIHKTYTNQLMDVLRNAVREKFESGWDWIWVADADFDNGIVIFCSDYGLFSTSFTINGLNVEVGDVAKPVVETVDYQVVEGDVMVSVDFLEDVVDEALSSLVKGAIKHEEVKTYLVKAHAAAAKRNSVNAEDNSAVDKNSSANTTDITKGAVPLETVNKEEFLKSTELQDLIKAQVADAVAAAKAEAEASAQEAITKANNEAEELRKAAAARVEEEYTTVIKSYDLVEEDKVEALVKYLISNAEIADTIVKAFEKASNNVETVKKEFGKEVGVEAQDQSSPAKTSSDLIRLKAAELKKSNAQK